jgi:hypothetical protein
MLGESAFAECGALRSICIPSSVETISKYCFNMCWGLSELTFEPGDKVLNIGESAFDHSALGRRIMIPESVRRVSGIGQAGSGTWIVPVGSMLDKSLPSQGRLTGFGDGHLG